MNQKAQIATVVAVLLGIFLVVVTAIKFDWVGMVVRGESIFKFGEKETVKPHTEKEEPETSEPEEGVEGELISLSCTLNDQSTDLQIRSSYDFQFIDDALINSDQSVTLAYTLPETKGAFDQAVAQYHALADGHNLSPAISVSEMTFENNYGFTENISYSDESVDTVTPALTFNRTMVPAEVQDILTDQGYICTQS